MYSSSGNGVAVTSRSGSSCGSRGGVEGELRSVKEEAGDDTVCVGLVPMVSSSEKLIEIVGWMNRPLVSRMVFWFGRRGASVRDLGLVTSMSLIRSSVMSLSLVLSLCQESRFCRFISLSLLGRNRSVVTRWSSPGWQCRAGQI